MKKVTDLFIPIFIFFVLAVVGFAYFYILKKPNLTLRKTEVTIGATTFDVEVASTTLERARGLSFRDGLGEKQGMLFLFDSSSNYGFWMKDMKFAIDMIWIKGDRVAGFSENVAPEPGVPLWKLKIYYPPEAVDKVLEVGAGMVAKDGIKVGDSAAIRYE
jgi:uncharacterized protein